MSQCRTRLRATDGAIGSAGNCRRSTCLDTSGRKVSSLPVGGIGAPLLRSPRSFATGSRRISRSGRYGLVNGVEQREKIIEPSQLDGANHGTGVIYDDVQWLAAPLGSACGVDQGLQTRRT